MEFSKSPTFWLGGCLASKVAHCSILKIFKTTLNNLFLFCIKRVALNLSTSFYKFSGHKIDLIPDEEVSAVRAHSALSGQIWDSREPLIMQNPAQPDEGVNCENHHQIVDS